MPISERDAGPRQNIVSLIAEAIGSRGDLYQLGGAEAVAETILADYEREIRGGLCETCLLAPREICRTCGGKTTAPPIYQRPPRPMFYDPMAHK